MKQTTNIYFLVDCSYTILVIVIAFAVMFAIFNIQRLFYRKDKDYETYTIFVAAKMKKRAAEPAARE